MTGFIWRARPYMDTSTNKSTAVGHSNKDFTIPTNKIVKSQVTQVVLSIANSARTADPRLWVYIIDQRDHPATSSDVVLKFPAPATQALNTTRNYLIGDLHPNVFDTDAAVVLAATDYLVIPIPELVLSTAMLVRFYIENDTGVATDHMDVYGTYLIADKSGGPG